MQQVLIPALQKCFHHTYAMLYSTDDIIHITQTHTPCVLRVLDTAVRAPNLKLLEINAFSIKAGDVPQIFAKPPVTPLSQARWRQKAHHGIGSGDLQLIFSKHKQRKAFGVKSTRS